MKTLQELNEIRLKMQSANNLRTGSQENTRVVVGMATCGIAAGARPVMQALMEEVSRRQLSNVVISQTGCVGMCKYEPIVDVYVAGQPKVTYIRVTPEVAVKIINEHVVNGKIVTDNLMKN